ncbi:MAG: hypothetical protein M1823_001342 [Watsoniomyces obsoletus]|nr:MAG: hypothetical protein M1823_001342 [Watsoniomyces obsoletus]
MKEARAIYERCVRRTLSHGTTTAAYYATISVKSTNLLADICLELGQRALIGRVAMDTGSPDSYRDPSAEEALQRTKASIAYIESIDPSGDLIQPIITPRFALGCSRQSMQLLGQLHRNANVPVQTHISETEGECQAVEEKYPGHTYASVYDEMGLLGEQTILAHAIHLSRQERALLSQRGARISHCPLSNDALGSGAARVRWLLDGGLIVGLGTDVSGGYSPSVLQAARQACLVSRRVAETEGDDAKLSVPEVLHLATKGGAKVLGLKNKIGELSEGMCWDAQLIELAHVPENSKDLSMPVDIFGHEDWNEKIAKWVFNGDDRNTVAVWVNGRLVHGSIKE